MRTDLQILQAALADKALDKNNFEEVTKFKAKFIKLYTVNLPAEKFKGLPAKWLFGIFSDKEPNEIDNQSIFDEAREILIQSTIEEKQRPIVFISDDRRISFSEKLTFKDSPVFFLYKDELPGRDDFPKDAKDTPVMSSARMKFTESESLIYLSPYSPNLPVSDWQFFGRKKEIKDILKSRSNYFVLGSRKIGKTSLLQEVKRQLEDRNETVHWIVCQDKHNVKDIIDDIINKLSEKNYYHALLKDKNLEINFIPKILKRLKGNKRNIVLIFDELGNVINKIGPDSWKFIGALREVSHNNNIRMIISAFQEVIIRQTENPEGPFVNFGTTMQLHSFKKDEIEELLVAPLSFWGKIKNKKDFGEQIQKYFGSHPLILSFVGQRLVELIVDSEKKKEKKYVDDFVEQLFYDELYIFESAVDDIFTKSDSYIDRFVFLSLCNKFYKSRKDKDLTEASITHDILEKILDDAGIQSDFDTRMLLMDRLSLRGLLGRDTTNRSIYRIETPIVYHYLKKFDPPEGLIKNYLKEIHKQNKEMIKY